MIEALTAEAPLTILMPRDKVAGDSPILVAEDEAMLRTIAVEMLEDAGLSVRSGDGRGAELLKANPQIARWYPISRCRAWTLCPGQAGLAFKRDLKVLLMTGYPEPPPQVKAQEIQILRNLSMRNGFAPSRRRPTA